MTKTEWCGSLGLAWKAAPHSSIQSQCSAEDGDLGHCGVDYTSPAPNPPQQPSQARVATRGASVGNKGLAVGGGRLPR